MRRRTMTTSTKRRRKIVSLICFSITELSSSETTEVTTNAFTYQNTVVSEKISEQSTETTAIPISRGQTTKRPSAGISELLKIKLYHY